MTSIWIVLLGSIGMPAVCGQDARVDAASFSDISSTPPAVDKTTETPTAYIQGWSFGDELHPTKLVRDQEIALSPTNPEITLFFGSNGLWSNDTEFRYRLDGYDSDWTVTKDRIAHYRRLAGGKYQFRVQAREPGQPWPTTEAVLPIAKRRYICLTWWAWILVGAIVLSLAVQVFKQRDQLLKGQIGLVLQERNRIASECHDTLMAGFAAISWQLEATAKLLKSLPSEHPAIESCDLARSMVSHCQAEARRIIWDLRDSDEITDSLSLALGNATATYRERESPTTTLEVHGTEIPISPAAVHHLVCIGQEAVTNAIRHANPSNIRIKLSYEDELLSLTVHDNGKGFHLSDKSQRAGHFGIPVMEERARKLGGILHLNSSVGGGTEVSVIVSVHRIHQPQYVSQPQSNSHSGSIGLREPVTA